MHSGSHTRTGVLVVGMHRSGTSALARVLNLLGASLPNDILPSDPTNPAGHWEPRAVVEIHDELLNHLHSSWDDLQPFDPHALIGLDGGRFFERLKSAVVREFGDASVFVLKDPRVCRFLPLWHRLFAEMRIAPALVLIVRNPIEVADSLQQRNGFTVEKSLLLWLSHVLEAEYASRGLPRVITSYDRLIADWQDVVTAAERAFDLTWRHRPEVIAPEVSAFLSESHRHHRATLSDVTARAGGFPWIVDTWNAVNGLVAADDEPGRHALDGIRQQFQAAAALFGAVVSQTSRAQREESVRADGRISHLEGRTRQRQAEFDAEIDRHRHELSSLTTTVSGLETALDAERAQSSALRSNVAARETQIADLEIDAGQLRARLDRETGRKAQLQAALEQRQLEVERLQRGGEVVAAENRALRTSRSWRWTAPLRALQRLLTGH